MSKKHLKSPPEYLLISTKIEIFRTLNIPMAKQQSKDELMAEFFRMLMADAQQAQKASGPHEEHMMDSFPRYREADNVLKYTVRVALRGVKR